MDDTNSMQKYQIGCKALQADIRDELYDMYVEGVRSYRDIPDDRRLPLLSKLSLLELTWIDGDWVNCGDEMAADLIKNSLMAQILSLALMWASKGNGCSTYEMQLNNLLEVVAQAAERHFEQIVNQSFEGLDEVPEYLNKVLHGGLNNE